MRNVLVTGATGALGPTVVAALLEAGFNIRVLCRQSPTNPLWPAIVEIAFGDITDPAAVTQAVAGCDAVIHMAALLHIVNPDPTLRAEYERVNVQGTAQLVAAAVAQGVQRLLYVSTIAVYGHGRPTVISEATPPTPDSFYGATKLAAEGLVLAARRADGEPLGVVLRLAAVYGARVKGNYARLVTGLQRGRFLPLGPGDNRRTLVHEADVAAALLLALTHPAALGHVYNVTDGSSHTLRQIIAAICLALGRTPPRITLPLGPVRLAAELLEDGYRLVGRQASESSATIAKYSEEMVVDGTLIQQELGFTPHYTLTAGWQQALQGEVTRPKLGQ